MVTFMLNNLVDDLQKGLQIDDKTIYSKKVDKGRINNQKYLEVYLKKGGSEKLLFYLSIYQGKKPYYKPWVEIFGVNNQVRLNQEIITYFGTELESMIIEKISDYLGFGGRIFVEYSGDKETRSGLLRDYPEVTTRLGYKLYQNDFTWFKDWYYPEGFNEGGEKLQAEKPIDEEHELKHYKRMKEEIDRFLKQDFEENQFYRNAVDRAEKILEEL